MESCGEKNEVMYRRGLEGGEKALLLVTLLDRSELRLGREKGEGKSFEDIISRMD